MRFVAFGSEEVGLHGAHHFVETHDHGSIKRLLNVDGGGESRTPSAGGRHQSAHGRVAVRRDGHPRRHRGMGSHTGTRSTDWTREGRKTSHKPRTNVPGLVPRHTEDERAFFGEWAFRRDVAADER